jgi:hypothetical protein
LFFFSQLKLIGSFVQDSEEANSACESKSSALRRQICGLESNRTDDSKQQTEQNQPIRRFKEDLDNPSCSLERVQEVAKVIAELAKDGKRSSASCFLSFFRIVLQRYLTLRAMQRFAYFKWPVEVVKHMAEQ